MRVSLCCALTLFQGPGFADTLLVPGEFSTIQAAIDAASPGDTVLISPAQVYVEEVHIVGRNVALVSASPEARVALHTVTYGAGPPLTISGGARVTLESIALGVSSGSRQPALPIGPSAPSQALSCVSSELTAIDCRLPPVTQTGGTIHLERCLIHGYAGTGGVYGGTSGGASLKCQQMMEVTLVSSEFHGGGGGSMLFMPPLYSGGSGGPGVSISGTPHIQVTGCTLTGGAGGNGDGSILGGAGGAGGSGLLVSGPASVRLERDSLLGGAGGFGFPGGQGGDGLWATNHSSICSEEVAAAGGPAGAYVGTAVDGLPFRLSADSNFCMPLEMMVTSLLTESQLASGETLTGDQNGDGRLDAADIVRFEILWNW